MPAALLVEMLQAIVALTTEIPSALSLGQSAIDIVQSGNVTPEQEAAIRAQLDAVKSQNRRGRVMLLVIILLLVILLPGGYYANRQYPGGYGLGGVVGIILIVLVVLFLFGGFGSGFRFGSY